MSSLYDLTAEEMTIWAIIVVCLIVVVVLIARGERHIDINDHDKLD